MGGRLKGMVGSVIGCCYCCGTERASETGGCL